MAALTPTEVVTVDIGGGTNQLKIFTVTPQANGDTVDLSSYFSGTILACLPQIIAGQDAALTVISAAISTTTITLTELEQDGTAATDWTGASVALWCVGPAQGV
jgi:hypothetical protein